MEKIPTAEELENRFSFLTTYYGENTIDFPEIRRFAIEFAQLHVQAALEAVVEKGDAAIQGDEGSDFTGIYLDRDTILNAYPLTNIK